MVIFVFLGTQALHLGCLGKELFIIFLDDPFYFYKVLNFIFDFSNLTVPSLFLVDMDKVFLDLFIESTSGFIVFCSLLFTIS